MWPWYKVNITVCMALLVGVLCQPVYSCIDPSLHELDFFLGNLFMETCFCSFLIKIFEQFVMLCRPCNCGWSVILTPVYTNKWLPTASTLSLPHNKAQVVCKSQLCSKQSSNGQSPENFMTIGSWLECYIHISRYGARLAEERRKRRKKKKKERKKKWTILTFDCFQQVNLPLTTHCYYYCRPRDRLYKLL